jgi:putative transposase
METAETQKKTVVSRSDAFLASSMKNMRLALADLSMEEFVKQNLQAMFGLEREEYLEQAIEDKGNGYYSRSLTALLKNGLVIEVPRTRNNGFAPLALQLFKMSQDQVNELCLTLYKKGMTSRDVSDVMESFFGNSLSHTSINKLAEQFHAIRTAWENSSLEEAYSAIFCDCIFITVRRGDSYSKEAVYVCYGVNTENKRELLGLSINPTESVEKWESIFLALKQRGVKQVQLVIADGINLLEEVVLKTFPSAKFQKCVVHKMRNVLLGVRPKDKAEVGQDLKQVFDNFSTDSTKEQAKKKAEDFCLKWESKYSEMRRFFREETFEYYLTYIDFPPDVRRLIYTTNSIENLNRGIRKGTKNKLSFESPETLLDYVFVIIKEFETKNWSRFPVHQFSLMHNS